jgi:hypothetical protein
LGAGGRGVHANRRGGLKTLSNQETLDMVANEVNKLVDQLGWFKTPAYRYWRKTLDELEPTRHRGFKKRLHKKDNYAFAYTTEPAIDDEGKKVWFAIKYRIARVGVTREKWQMVKHRSFKHPRKAREKAYSWYAERCNKLRGANEA